MQYLLGTSWTFQRLLVLADLGALPTAVPARTVWVNPTYPEPSSRPAMKAVHWHPDCSAAIGHPARPVDLATWATTRLPDGGAWHTVRDGYASCTACDTGAAPLLDAIGEYDFRAVTWLDTAAEALARIGAPTCAPTPPPLAQTAWHSPGYAFGPVDVERLRGSAFLGIVAAHVTGTWLTGSTPTCRAAVAAMMDRLTAAREAGTELGLARRVRWLAAFDGVRNLEVDKQGPVPGSSFADFDISAPDLADVKAFHEWALNQTYTGAPCPARSLDTLDEIADRIMATRSWVIIKPGNLKDWQTELIAALMFATETSRLTDEEVLACVPRVTVTRAWGSQDGWRWVGADAGYAADEVALALGADLTGTDLPDGIAAVRAATA